MLNHIVIMGRLTRDPELRRTSSGVAVAGFTLAVDRDYKPTDGGDRETDFIDCVAYANKPMTEFAREKNYADEIPLTSLRSICTMVCQEKDKTDEKIFVRVVSPTDVRVFTGLDEDRKREHFYRCCADTPRISVNQAQSYQHAIIELRSLYIPNDGSAYLLRLLSSISEESKVVSSDNGVTQTVEAKKGINLSEQVPIEPRVILRPFRTFIEVDQPESEFLLRLEEGSRVALWEADGGVWKLEATRNVAAYFETELADLIEEGKVVVLR